MRIIFRIRGRRLLREALSDKGRRPVQEEFAVREHEIEYRIATGEDMELLMSSRLEMLREVNDLPQGYVFDRLLVEESRAYFAEGRQTTVLALEERTVVGCATLCYIGVMPTFSHPTGKRAHLMNVYTKKAYRRQGIAARMAELLIQEARDRGVTEISLDATLSGRPLYEKLGFAPSAECMVLCIGE